MAMAVSSSVVLRVRGLPSNKSIDEVTSLLERSLQIRPDACGLKITSLAEDPYQVDQQVATLMFLKEIPPPFTTSTTQQWSISVSEADCSSESLGERALTFDTHFHGLTALNTPRPEEGAVDCIAVCGLGGHALGSFKERGSSHIWLRDSLPKDLPNLRVLLYGYESRLESSDSNQNISNIADSFVSHLSILRPRSRHKPISTPLVIIAHSLGGLVVKQAILKLGHGNELDKKQMQSIVGLLFFGVPNRGMDIESLRAIVGDEQNRYLLESVGKYSDILLNQDRQFSSTFHFKDSRIISFFETMSSPTAIKVNGSWKMAGPSKIVVPQFSATLPRLWESDEEEPLNRSHSDLVKFSAHDVDYRRVLHRLEEVVSVASRTITSRYLSQESPDVLNKDEEACLRSLSFTEIYARESIIEPAVPDTGNWLLESQNFQDWIQRKRLNEHRGVFWVQGNPGSGKSTLMKKTCSHVIACPQEPSSIIAAFFFNARGNEIEKSPTGLFRTLLHKLCQQMSALRDLVVKAYVTKRRILAPDWQWQFSELKEFLDAAVTPSVLGQRSLLLFVDALDECNFAATQSVIHAFEALASSSLSKGTNFSICLSSRYWPQFKIRNCFIARVELKNNGDIVKYIEKHLEPTQFDEDSELHAGLRQQIVDKAKGTFLWVVLVTRELLQANAAGATLRELRDIVQRVPPDLNEFYQHQLQHTKSEDRERMLRLLQLVYYAERPLSPTELRYALAFGCGAYASYAEWSQSSQYVRSDKQMEKRIREHSKGLVEIAKLPMADENSQYGDEDFQYGDEKSHYADDGEDSALSRPAIVQFIHQSARDFLTENGFSLIRETRPQTQSADGHEFMKTACLNYLRIKDLEAIPTVDLRVSEQFHSTREMLKFENDHPLLDYAVRYIFPHAAQAEKHGISQDGFRTYICSNMQGCFERWRCLHDEVNLLGRQGPQTRPIHILAQYGLLTQEIAEKERCIDIVGGKYGSALVAACWGGHNDVVQMLLGLGAHPRFSTRINLFTPYPWDKPIAPFMCAVEKQDLPVLRQLLNDRRSSLTLEERLKLASTMKNENPQLEAFLALLFPEHSFPDSVTDDVCEAAAQSTLGVFSFLLDKSPHTIVHEEKLWHHILSNSYYCLSKINILLDHGGKLQITEDFIEVLSRIKDAAQIIRTFEAAGYRLGPFTPKQLSWALRYGTVETAAFFLQRKDGNTAADEMLNAALSNWEFGKEVTRLLLGYLNPDHINERALIAALSNGPCGEDLIRLLYSRWSSLTFSEAALAAAVRWQRSTVIEFVLERCECSEIADIILTEAAENSAKSVDHLLNYDPAIRVQESTVVAAIINGEAPATLSIICKHDKPLFCTPHIVAAAAESDKGPESLEIILQQDRDAKLSSIMIMTAMGGGRSAALISVMLHHDQTIDFEEEHLVAAALNPYDPKTIFAFLQTKGKLKYADPATDILDTGIAKRHRISHKASHRISTKVINAAFCNPNRGARLQLLELFVEWGVITATDLENGMLSAHTRPHIPFSIPPISQLFPGI